MKASTYPVILICVVLAGCDSEAPIEPDNSAAVVVQQKASSGKSSLSLLESAFEVETFADGLADPDGNVTTVVTYSDEVDVNPNGIVFNRHGALFIAELLSGEITKVPSGTTLPVDTTNLPPFAAVSQPTGLAIAPNGDLFVAGREEIFRITPSGTVTTIVSGLAGGYNRITFGKPGLFFTDMFAGTVMKISRRCRKDWGNR